MRKLLLLLVIAGAGAFVFTSCEKAYTCTQKDSVNGTLVNTTIYSYDALTAEEKTDQENLNTFSYVDGNGDQLQRVTTCD